MAAAAWSVEQVQEVVRVLYHEQSPQLKKQADVALKAFQRSREAWHISHAILAQTPPPSPSQTSDVVFFAAATLFDKVFHDYNELTADQRIPFRDAVIQHLKTHINGSKAVLTQLSLAIASLAVQMEEWEDPATDMMQLLGGYQRERTVALLHIFTVLPEECSSKRRLISEERMSRVCYRNCARVLELLQMILRHCSDIDIHDMTFRCLRSWLRFACVQVDENVLIQCPLLLNDCFQAIQASPHLLQSACEVVAAAFELSSDRTMRLLAERLAVSTIACWPRYEQALGADDFECQQSLLQLFCEMVEWCMPFVFEMRPLGRQIVALLAQCTTNPDPELSIITFHSWYDFSEHIASVNAQDAARASQISSFYASELFQVIDTLRLAARLPDDYETLSRDAVDERKRFRHNVSETLLDISSLLDSPALLQRMLTATKAAAALYKQDQSAWQELEACLYCIRAMARSVRIGEQNVAKTVLPQIMGELLQLPSHPLVRYTATLVVGRYSDWVGLNTQYLEPLLHFVVAGLQEHGVESSAAMAFKYICLSCSAHLAQHSIEAIFQVYASITNLSLDDQREIIAGVCSVVTACPPAQSQAVIQRLIEPVVQALSAAVALKDSDPSNALLQTGLNLDRLAHMFKSLHFDPQLEPPLPLPAMWPLLSQTAVLFQNDEQMMEKMCRLLKCSLRACGASFPLLLPLSQLVLELYASTPHSCFLYTVNVALEEFSRSPTLAQHTALFAHLLDVLGQRTFALLKDANAVRDHPDVAEDFFHLLKRYVEVLPTVLFASPLLVPSFQCASCGVRVRHREASNAVYSYLRSLVEAGASASAIPSVRSAVDSVLRQGAQLLFEQLVQALQDDLSRTQIRNLVDLVRALLSFSRQLCSEFLPGALTKLPSSIPHKNEFCQRLLNAASPIEQREALLDLEGVVRRYAKRH